MTARHVSFLKRLNILAACFFLASAYSCLQPDRSPGEGDRAAYRGSSIHTGWGEADITPEAPVYMAGMGVRVSKGARDQLTATALALESFDGGSSACGIVMVSCDLLNISDCLRDGVREHLARELPELDPASVFFSATHTHTGPYTFTRPRYVEDAEEREYPGGGGEEVMPVSEYVRFASRRIADAVIEAWKGREPSGIAYGLGHAVVGRNRIMSYKDGTSTMYGLASVPEFSHVEGYEDHSVHILGTYRPDGELTGLIVNIACPSQISMGVHLSADFWHETRKELRRRFGDGLSVLAQHSAAGDQDSRAPVEGRAEQRMWRLAGLSQREVIAARIADAAEQVLPLIESEINWHPELMHRSEVIGLQRRIYSEEDVAAAFAESDRIGATVRRRHEAQKTNPLLPVEVHAVRLGDVGFLTNPFELYLDYGTRIRGRSPAKQTFIVQLAGPGSYLPTRRAVKGGAYGASPRTNEVGPEGGETLVEWSVGALEEFWRLEDKIIPGLGFRPEIDGDISAWEGRPYIRIGSRDPERLWAKVYTGWDEDNFYLAVEVNDDAHFNTREGGSIWDGDSLQFAFGPREEAGAFNLGVALASGRARSHQWAGPDTGIFEKGEYAVLRDDETGRTFYEVRIPFECLMMEGETGKSLAFNAVVFNDNDGTGYVNWIEISRGLAGGWDPGMFTNFILAD